MFRISQMLINSIVSLASQDLDYTYAILFPVSLLTRFRALLVRRYWQDTLFVNWFVMIGVIFSNWFWLFFLAVRLLLLPWLLSHLHTFLPSV